MTQNKITYREGQQIEIEVYNSTIKASQWLPGWFKAYVSALDRNTPRINCSLTDGREISGAAPECVRPFLIDDFEALRAAVDKAKAFVPVTERIFYYALEVLPPTHLKNGTFQMGECYTADLYYTFGEKDGHYWGCLCNRNYSINNF